MCILILVLCKFHPNNKNICVQALPSVPWLWKRHFFYSLYSIYIKGKDDRSKISIALNSCDFQKSNFHCWNEHKTKWDIMPITVALAPEWLCVHRKIHLMEKFCLKFTTMNMVAHISHPRTEEATSGRVLSLLFIFEFII